MIARRVNARRRNTQDDADKKEKLLPRMAGLPGPLVAAPAIPVAAINQQGPVVMHRRRPQAPPPFLAVIDDDG